MAGGRPSPPIMPIIPIMPMPPGAAGAGAGVACADGAVAAGGEPEGWWASAGGACWATAGAAKIRAVIAMAARTGCLVMVSSFSLKPRAFSGAGLADPVDPGSGACAG
jgi:hypothetical protein